MRRSRMATIGCLGVLCILVSAAQAAQRYKLCSTITPQGKVPDLEKLKREVAQNYGDEYARKVIAFLHVLDDPKDMKKSTDAPLRVVFDVAYALKSEDYARARLLRDFLNPAGVQATAPSLASRDDWYKVAVTVSRSCYVYVFQMDTTGKIDPLFPNEDFLSGVTNPLRGDTYYEIPAAPDWAFLDDNVGIEKIYLMACKKQKHALEALYPYFIDAGPKIVEGTWKRVMDSKAEPLPMPDIFASVGEGGGITLRGCGGIRKGPKRKIKIKKTKLQRVDVEEVKEVPYQPTIFTASHDELVKTHWFRHVARKTTRP